MTPARHMVACLAATMLAAAIALAQPAQPPPFPIVSDAGVTEPGGAIRALEAGEQALELGFTSAARLEFEWVLARPDLNADARHRAAVGLASTEIGAGRAEAAEAALDRGANRDDPVTRLRRAMIALQRNSTDLAAAELATIREEDMPVAEVAWFFTAHAMVGEAQGDFDWSQELYGRAMARAVSEPVRARILLAQERAKLVAGQATEALATQLRRQVDDFQGRKIGYDFAAQYAVVLDQLDRRGEAVSHLEQQLQALPGTERDAGDRFRLLLALIAGPSSGTGQNALRQLLAGGNQTVMQRIALQLLAGLQDPAGRELFRTELDTRIAEQPPSRILDELLIYRARFALSRQEYGRAEEDARTLIAHFPASQMRVPALNVLVATAWELRRYRTAADTIVQLRSEIRDPVPRAGLAVLLAEAYFRAGDYLAAAAAYGQALDEQPVNILRGLLMFQQGLSLIRAGDLDQAQRMLDARADDPGLDVVNRWQSEWNLAKSMQVAGRTTDAFARLNRLLAVGQTPVGLPGDLRLRMEWLRARLSLDAGMPSETLQYADALLAMLAGDEGRGAPEELRRELAGTTQLLKAQALLALGRIDQGVELLTELRRDYMGTDPAIYSFIIQAGYLSAQGQTVEAQRLLIELADEHKDSDYAPFALYEAAAQAEKRGLDAHLREAFELLERIIKSFPTNELVFYARLKQGDLLRKLNQLGPAQQTYEFLLYNYQDHRDAALVEIALADTLFAQSATDAARLESALARYERLFDLPSAPTDLRLEAGFKHGIALASRGNEVAARRILWLPVARFLLDDAGRAGLGSRGRYWLARCLLEYGRLCEQASETDEAREAYQLILRYGLGADNLARARLARFTQPRPAGGG
ncbi:MAG TPA: hypothetical protein VMM36_12385 [Opitutaceae bacterium]|nr:hypothetical protein [Opitutaceae bacterium]